MDMATLAEVAATQLPHWVFSLIAISLLQHHNNRLMATIDRLTDIIVKRENCD